MTIEQYLAGSVDFNLRSETLATILFRRGVTEGSLVTSLTQRQLDLCLADLYMFLVTSSTSSSGDYESDGGWQKQHSAKNVYNRGALQSLANQLYAKWGETTVSAASKITMKSLY